MLRGIWPGELSSSLWKKGFGVKVSGQVPFESCEDFLLCAAPMFIPCVLWSLEATSLLQVVVLVLEAQGLSR